MDLLVPVLSDLKGELLFVTPVLLFILISKRRKKRFQGDPSGNRVTSRTSEYYSTEIDEFKERGRRAR